ncbi:hypothetical protein MRX96_017230 [Rhipicephalus microplus]
MRADDVPNRSYAGNNSPQRVGGNVLMDSAASAQSALRVPPTAFMITCIIYARPPKLFHHVLHKPIAHRTRPYTDKAKSKASGGAQTGHCLVDSQVTFAAGGQLLQEFRLSDTKVRFIAPAEILHRSAACKVEEPHSERLWDRKEISYIKMVHPRDI